MKTSKALSTKSTYVRIRKKTLLPIVFGCVLYSCNNSNHSNDSVKNENTTDTQTKTATADTPISDKAFAGSWYWKSEDSNSSFKIILNQENDSIYGQYCAAYNRGNRMDCDFDTAYNISGKISENVASIHFNSFYGAKDGTAQLTLKDNTLTWEIKKFPEGGDCFAPERADLTHKNQNW